MALHTPARPGDTTLWSSQAPPPSQSVAASGSGHASSRRSGAVSSTSTSTERSVRMICAYLISISGRGLVRPRPDVGQPNASANAVGTAVQETESGPVVEDEGEIGFPLGEEPHVGRIGQARAKIVLEVAEPVAK